MEKISIKDIENFSLLNCNVKTEEININIKVTAKRKEYETEVIELTAKLNTAQADEKNLKLISAVEASKLYNLAYETLNKKGLVSDAELDNVRRACEEEVTEIFLEINNGKQ